MKNIALFFCFLFLMSCQETSPVQHTDLYIYLDYTEGQNYTTIEKDLEHYLTLMNVSEEHPRNYGTMKLFPLYDIGSTPSATVKLKEGKSKFEGNKFLRQKEVEKFKSKVMDKVTKMNESYSDKELNKSHIVQPLSKGFKKLEQSDATRKVILIYSDMLENSDIANFHRNFSSEKLSNSLDKYWKTEDISEFEVFIVHPIDKKNDTKIQKSGSFWRDYLIKKGLDEDMYHFDTSIEVQFLHTVY